MIIVCLRYWGGYFRYPSDVAKWAAIMRSVAEAGWSPYLVSARRPDDPLITKQILETGARMLYMPRARGNFDARCIWRVYRLCKRLNCDIIHCDNIHTSPLIGAALSGVPVRVWSKLSMNPAYESMREPTLRERAAISTRISCGLATKVLPISNAVKNELMDLGIPSSKLRVLPNSAEIEEINPGIRKLIRTELGYTDDEVVFTTVGHAVPVKGWDILLKAFARTVHECPKARLQYVGNITDDHEREHYQLLIKSIAEWGIAGQVRFVGHQAHIHKALFASDVFVLPSRSEGNSGALLEAMTCGLPCVATKVGYAPDIIQNGVNGFLVERGSEDELSKAMIGLADDRILRSRVAIAVQAQKKYAPTFSEYGDQLVDIYRELLRSQRQLHSRSQAAL